MKKLVATGTTLALLLAASSPAMAQTIGDDVEFLLAPQFQFGAALQTNDGSADAVADDGGMADAAIDQSLTIDQSQINGGFDDDFDDDFVLFFD